MKVHQQALSYMLSLATAKVNYNGKEIYVKDLFKNGETEVSLFREDTKTKVRFDYVDKENGIIRDLKTTSKPITQESIQETMESLGYDLSAYVYCEHLQDWAKCSVVTYELVFVHKPTGQWTVARVSDTTLRKGQYKYKMAVDRVNKWKEGGKVHLVPDVLIV